MTPLLIGLAVTIALLLIGVVVGKLREQQHIRELDAREAAQRGILLTDLRTLPPGMRAVGARLVTGESVIATDYWKTFISQLKRIVGGEVQSLGTLMTRSRREARARMVEEAMAMGASVVINVRIETSEIGGQRAPITEVLAYGTAVVLSE